MRVCKVCGEDALLKEGMTVCPTCGKNPEEVAKKESKKKKKGE